MIQCDTYLILLDVFAKNKFTNLIDYYKSISVDLQPSPSEEDFFNGTSSSYLAVNNQPPPPEKVFVPDMGSICFDFTRSPVKGRLGVINPINSLTIRLEKKPAGLIIIGSEFIVLVSSVRYNRKFLNSI